MATTQDLKTKIASALSQLDHKNPEHWVDDGLPRTSVVRTLAADETITRQNINETAPGFARMASKPDETVDAAPIEPLTQGSAPEAATTESTVADLTDLNPEDVRSALHARTVAAEQALAENAKAIQELQFKARELGKTLQKARQDEMTKFPPLTAAQNIQLHLRSEFEKRLAMAQGRAPSGGNIVDYGGGAGRRVGSPKPMALGMDGKLVIPQSRNEIARQARRALPSAGVGAVPQQR